MAASPAATPSGYGPSQLQSAYNLAAAAAADGSGETVYIVDAYDYPTAQADLNTYRSQYGLPACGSGCFTKVNQNGATSPLPSAAGSTGWDVEESLDIDMVSAICPLCHITLVEANSASNSGLYTAENSAVSLGGKFISNSWGGSEYSSEATDANTYFNHPGVAITVSAGDTPGPEFPAESEYVTAVGGTTLNTSSNSRGWTESPWSSSGGGCSSDETAPSWQSSAVTGCSRREDNDVSADADPNTGAAIYNSYSQGGWLQVGGTSESSPIIASVYALAGTPASGSRPSQDIWTHEPSGLYPVGSGYASVPGWGTPDGTTAFTSGTGTGTGPYGGTPAAVPGTVQAANYDTGGQGTAYNVTSVNGSANSYRPDGVDLEACTDTGLAGCGDDLGWTSAGQWFKYTVNVATAGTYTVSFRLASPSGVTDALHIANSAGANLSGSVSVAATGGWQTWTTVTATVTLPAGQQTLTIDQDNGGWNIRQLAFAASGSAAFGGTPAAVPGTVQAANYDTGGQGTAYNVTSVNGTGNSYRPDGVDLEACTDTGCGDDLGWTGTGQWFKYTVNATRPGPTPSPSGWPPPAASPTACTSPAPPAPTCPAASTSRPPAGGRPGPR